MSAGHGEIRLGDAGVLGCGRSARELGGHCTRCWMALTAAQRAHLVWLQEVDHQAAVNALQALYELPDAEPRGRAA